MRIEVRGSRSEERIWQTASRPGTRNDALTRPSDPLSPQRGEGRGEGCDNPWRSHDAAGFVLDQGGAKFGVRDARFAAQHLLRPSDLTPRPSAGFLLIDCVVYIALLLLLMTLAFAAFYRTLDNSKRLNREAADIARALQAGERWRADVRAATAPPRLEATGTESVLHLPRAQGEVRYTFRDGTVLRQDTAATNAAWEPALLDVKSSRLLPESRRRVNGWRWELELTPVNPRPRMKPLFTFQAVAAPERKP